MAKITWRVRKRNESGVRVRVAEYTTAQPMTVNAAWTAMSTQSTLRRGSAGLARMLPSPESGLRCSRALLTGRSRTLVHEPTATATFVAALDAVSREANGRGARLVGASCSMIRRRMVAVYQSTNWMTPISSGRAYGPGR